MGCNIFSIRPDVGSTIKNTVEKSRVDSPAFLFVFVGLLQTPSPNPEEVKEFTFLTT
ncbi:MAG: hypothetical protein H6Q57_694 [Geobacteraceae bacterium]|jgi:hypothetical protein|nr:hypothetical protein [Geobacteraceae bacterium]